MITDAEMKVIKRAAEGDRDAFEWLFNFYRPIFRKVRRNFFIAGMETEDIEQEARIVLYRSAQKFEDGRNVSFGSYYSHNLKKRVFDLIRSNNAQKRLPTEFMNSVEENEAFYSTTVADTSAWDPEALVIMNDDFHRLYKSCSGLERWAFALVLPNSPDPMFCMATDRSVLNAFERCRLKYLNRIS
ncbi:helix-turn-helix domain-containing protein [Lentilactobacillus sp. IMAU92037]|uniref:sigma factor n=1 Tax=Lentilactobacillus dabitei TaxID=2831523 RepID=UPI001C279677|nr:sigma factor [Lentilactobacillus dabitei]MBU9788604.1 helix-turn-helix domain-containing protein [Lentilactobacillus dabitei]MBV0929701.1 helix-turn-helix domain-containing protein [Lentilactobacillus dabitei]